MKRDDRTTAIGLARYAREYHKAALAADDATGKTKAYMSAPVMFLVGHSLELALKAYLLHRGLTLDDLKNLGHRLDTSWRIAVAGGLEDHVRLTKADVAVLETISDLHASTELRYIQIGSKTWPARDPVVTLARKLLDAVCPLVGYR